MQCANISLAYAMLSQIHDSSQEGVEQAQLKCEM